MRQYKVELWKLAGQLHRGDLSPESKVFIKGVVALAERLERVTDALDQAAPPSTPNAEIVH